jgi:hypothetical protein
VYGLLVIGGILFVGALFLGMCAWMAYDYGNQPGWGWLTVKYAVSIAGIFGAMGVFFWALQGYGVIH